MLSLLTALLPPLPIVLLVMPIIPSANANEFSEIEEISSQPYFTVGKIGNFAHSAFDDSAAISAFSAAVPHLTAE